jgi:hypothetical protein
VSSGLQISVQVETQQSARCSKLLSHPTQGDGILATLEFGYEFTLPVSNASHDLAWLDLKCTGPGVNIAGLEVIRCRIEIAAIA